MPVNAAISEKINQANMFQTCEQCGLCSSACPISGLDGFNVRRILRHVEMDIVEEIADSPIPWMCTACGRCETVCPNGIAILDIVRSLRGLAPDEYIPEVAPCVKACPAGIDVPGYLRFIAHGNPQQAYELILEKAPFPGILGRVCPHPCEAECRRNEVNQPISICALKRYAADRAENQLGFLKPPDNETGRRIAIIGSGPAGLTAAFYLRRKGHSITVFESREKPGGMMRYAIPAYRLPEEVVEREIELILSLGVDLKTNMQFGRDFDFNDLKFEGYEAVYLALGLQSSRKIDLEGSGLPEVQWGLDMLTGARNGRPLEMKRRVFVVGGGGVAIDAALTALRMGAEEVFLASLECREEMPASPHEIKQAEEEGVQILPSWGPKRIIAENGRVTGIELIECTSVFDDQCCFAPTFGRTLKTVSVDQVILAVGQSADLSCLDDSTGCDILNGLILTDSATGETNEAGVFAGGDVCHGPGAIVDAIASGKKGAAAIDLYLGGDGIIDRPVQTYEYGEYEGAREKGFADLERIPSPVMPLEERLENFKEVAGCYDDDSAVAEAKRCLQCDFEPVLAGRMINRGNGQ